MANNLQQHEFFYQAEAKLAEDFSGVKETQSVRVYKDGDSFKFDENIPSDRQVRDIIPENEIEENEEAMNNTESLKSWILRERFPKFVKVTRGRFGHLMSTKKLLVMAVLEENKLGEIAPDHEAFKSMLNTVLEMNIDKYRPHFQFGWTGSPDLANSVAMDTLTVRKEFHIFVTSLWIQCLTSSLANFA